MELWSLHREAVGMLRCCRPALSFPPARSCRFRWDANRNLKIHSFELMRFQFPTSLLGDCVCAAVQHRTSFLLQEFGMHELRVCSGGAEVERCWFMVRSSPCLENLAKTRGPFHMLTRAGPQGSIAL